MPQPLALENPELQSNETIKAFADQDSLAKAYVELHGKVSTGDMSILPEDVRKDNVMSRFKNVGDLAKSYLEANKVISGLKHAPKTVEEYKFTAFKDLHKGLENVGSTQKFLAQLFHANDIDNDRADKIQQAIVMGLQNAFVKQDEVRVAKSKEVETALRAEWGSDYDKNTSNIENVLKRLGVEDLGASVKNNPLHLKAMGKIFSLLSEDSIGKLGENTQTSVDTKSKEGAQKRINDIMGDPTLRAAVLDDKNPKHKEALKEWQDLHTVAYA